MRGPAREDGRHRVARGTDAPPRRAARSAIGNAVFNATDRRIRSLPITLDKLVETPDGGVCAGSESFEPIVQCSDGSFAELAFKAAFAA